MKERTDISQAGTPNLDQLREAEGAHHPSDDLSEYVLGRCPGERRAQVAQHLLQCPVCELEAAARNQALSELALLLPRPMSHAALTRGRARLLEDAEREPQRCAPRGGNVSPAPLAARLAQFFDLPEPRAADLLATLDQPQRWLTIPGAGQFLGVPPGPMHKQPGVMGMLLRVPAGFCMPHHLHRGDERTLVLRGGYRSSEGATYHEGDEAHIAAGQHHELYVLPDSECVLALLLHEGIEFTQEPDPR